MIAPPTVLLVDEDPDLRNRVREHLVQNDVRVLEAEHGGEGLDWLLREPVGIVFASREAKPMGGSEFLRLAKDRQPDLPIILTSADGTVEAAIAAIREGASDFLVKPFRVGAISERIHQFTVDPARGVDALVLEDARSRELLELAIRVAASDVTVMLNGESGVGKEVFARFLHARSSRGAKPFVAVNCAAIPENMLEAMLFGYERGAFTGAYESRAGKFELAQGGTLLLDEISEMNQLLQGKLLRVLQEREVERLGGKRTIHLDVRVIATSNRDLRAEVGAGRFREDLYYRLNVFPLVIPPLRDRPGDILPLARHFLTRNGRGLGSPELEPCAAARLLNHPWPGNVRELDNVIQRALILRRDHNVDAASIRFETGVAGADDPAGPEVQTRQPRGGVLDESLRNREEQLILDALRAERGRRKDVAARLGISPRTLRYKLARLREAGMLVG
jgi:two-component system response regulator FlrC